MRVAGLPKRGADIVLPAAILAVALFLFVTTSALGASFVTSLGVTKGDGGTKVVIGGDDSLEFEYFVIEGTKLVVDVADVGNRIWPTVYKVDNEFLGTISIAEHFQPRKMVRLVFEVKQPEDFTVISDGSRIVALFGKDPTRIAPSRPTAAEREPPVAVLDASVEPRGRKIRLTVSTNGEPEYRVHETGDPLDLVIDITDAVVGPKGEKSSTFPGDKWEFTTLKITQLDEGDDQLVRLRARLSRSLPYRVSTDDRGLYVDLDREAAPVLPAAARRTPARAPAAAEPAASSYSGRPVSLDFQNADVNDILRVISEVSELNFVAGVDVKGTHTIRMVDVPWDLALEAILTTNEPPLAKVRISENTYRIAPLAKVQQEELMRFEHARRIVEEQKRIEEAKKEADLAKEAAERQQEPLMTRSFKVSYAELDGGELMGILENFGSERLSLLEADSRTNTIIVRDVKANIDEMERVITLLDRPTPAVLVEARIVEVGTNFSHSLGVQWNAGYHADAAHGNALPLSFPNSVGLEGRIADEDNAYLVNLPAVDPVASLGMTIGHVANTLSLDLQLSAAESLGETKILSNPKILVVQNEEARIHVGDKLPVVKTSAEGERTVEFLPVGITLEVKPQVTNDRRVFMDLMITKNERGETVVTTEGSNFSIGAREAQTRVLVGDGETTVIGGLFQESTDELGSEVPVLSDLPVLGWLFRSKSRNKDRKELMIFLTPRIIDVSQPG